MIKIAFVGKMHSGKTTALNKIWELAHKDDKLPWLVKFAQPLYRSQELFIGDGQKNRLFLQDLSTLVKKHFGDDILSQVFKNGIKNIERANQEKTVLLCDDIRVKSDFNTARECGFTIVGIKASDEIRKTRNPKLFVGTNHETEIHVDELIRIAHIIVNGDLHIDKFREEIEFLWKGQFNI